MVWWLDSAGPSQVWNHIDEHEPVELVPVISVGYVVRADTTCLEVCQSYAGPEAGEYEGLAQVRGAMTIPWCTVQQIGVIEDA